MSVTSLILSTSAFLALLAFTVAFRPHTAAIRSAVPLNALKYVKFGKGMDSTRKLVDVDTPVNGGKMLEPTQNDMKQMAFVLNNITAHLEAEPEKALTVASQHMGWCFQRNVPQLTQMLLTQYPALREDQGMMKAYIFLLDFMEAVSKETGAMLTNNQNTLRILLEAAKLGEETLSGCLRENKESCCKEDFLVFLDTEIESQVRSFLPFFLSPFLLHLIYCYHHKT